MVKFSVEIGKHMKWAVGCPRTDTGNKRTARNQSPDKALTQNLKTFYPSLIMVVTVTATISTVFQVVAVVHDLTFAPGALGGFAGFFVAEHFLY